MAAAPPVLIRPLTEQDDLDALTALLHRAYAPQAARGLRFVASWQDAATTRHRSLGPGRHSLVALDGPSFIGMITLYYPREDLPNERVPRTYLRDGVAVFGQFAVDPARQHRGVGQALLAAAERRAAELGASEIACDTAEPAGDLRALYARWGFREAERCDWSATNYASIVLVRSLNPPAAAGVTPTARTRVRHISPGPTPLRR